ncbi:hypothetical protein DdX_11224 [Ditylenchus destructor]|uniref:Uncharacterized protein n=1 Tax=Ditylenchus destructor TaxID=166010 RepID=A0AAD4MX43_9BILA|nr:hypothetical protein DdX_11224 [Ditylenchus destructor]
MTFFNTTTERLWRTDMYYENKPEAQVNGKAIVRPLLVESVGQHDAHYWRDGYTENPLDTNKLGLFAIHVREGCHPCTAIQSSQPSSKNLRTEIAVNNRVKLHDGGLMQNNFQSFIDKYSLGHLMAKLPKKEQSVDHFNKCIDSMYQPAWKDAKRCRTYPQCTFPKIVHPCVNVNNRWENFLFDTENIMISVMRDSTFEKGDECLV